MFFIAAAAAAQEEDFFNSEDVIVKQEEKRSLLTTILDDIFKEPGFGVYTDYSVVGAYYPGWKSAFWESDFNGMEIFYDKQPLALEMRAKVGLDIQVSSVLSFWQVVTFSIPKLTIELSEFYAEYILLNHAFFKVGRYDYSWGLSPNYNYTNLISRVPDGDNPGQLYILRAIVPIYIGGLEFLGFTRRGYINVADPKVEEFALAGKFNLALRAADMNLGVAYFKRMPLRAFFSIKSTLFKSTEIYGEALLSVEHKTWDNWIFSGSIGFYNDFFKNKLRINAEMFYNGEDKAHFLDQDNPFEEVQKVFRYIPGFNLAFNVDYKPGVFYNLRLGMKFRYAINDNSGQLIPGVSIEPAKHLNIYLGVPIVLGIRSRQPYSFYNQNADKLNRPLSIVFVISLKGSYSFTRYRT